MVLGFLTQWGKPPRPTNFVQKILDGTKKHTLREDLPERWKAGNSIQFVTGNRTKYRKQFLTGECTGTQRVYLYCEVDTGRVMIKVGERPMSREIAAVFIRNDGFDSVAEFDAWFRPLIESAPGKLLTRKIIHWTDLRYA